MICIDSFDLELSENRQPVYIHSTAIFRHFHHICLHGRDFIRVTYQYQRGSDLQEHQFVVLSDGAVIETANLVFAGAACVNQAAMLVYRAPLNWYELNPPGTANITVSQSIHHITVT